MSTTLTRAPHIKSHRGLAQDHVDGYPAPASPGPPAVQFPVTCAPPLFGGNFAHLSKCLLVTFAKSTLNWPYPLSWNPNPISFGQPALLGPIFAAARPSAPPPALVDTLPTRPFWFHCRQFWQWYAISKVASAGLTREERVVRVAGPV